jgi:hypothetical protein
MNRMITSKDFIASFTAKHQLDSHRFNFTTQEVHRRTCADSGNIIRFKMVDDFGKCIQPILNCEHVLMVCCSKIIRGLPGGYQVRRILEADRKRVQPRPSQACCCKRFNLLVFNCLTQNSPSSIRVSRDRCRRAADRFPLLSQFELCLDNFLRFSRRNGSN